MERQMEARGAKALQNDMITTASLLLYLGPPNAPDNLDCHRHKLALIMSIAGYIDFKYQSYALAVHLSHTNFANAADRALCASIDTAPASVLSISN